MKITTIRLPEAMYESIEQEAEQQERSPTEYMRRILRNREKISQGDYAGESSADNDLSERVDELEDRVDKLESGQTSISRTTDNSNPDTDVTEWVRENQPASRSDITAALYSEDDEDIKQDTWWTNRARPQLEESGFTFTRNVGWSSK